MYLALLTNGLFPWAVGGMQKHSTNLIREWALTGVDLDVYFTQAPGYPAVEEIQRALVPAQASGRVRFFASAPSWLPYFPLHHYADCYVESCRMAGQWMRESPKTEFIYAQGLTGWKLLRMKRHGVQLPPIGVNLHGMEALQDFNGGGGPSSGGFSATPMSRSRLGEDWTKPSAASPHRQRSCTRVTAFSTNGYATTLRHTTAPENLCS